jgi:hypothetical protein
MRHAHVHPIDARHIKEIALMAIVLLVIVGFLFLFLPTVQ